MILLVVRLKLIIRINPCEYRITFGIELAGSDQEMRKVLKIFWTSKIGKKTGAGRAKRKGNVLPTTRFGFAEPVNQLGTRRWVSGGILPWWR